MYTLGPLPRVCQRREYRFFTGNFPTVKRSIEVKRAKPRQSVLVCVILQQQNVNFFFGRVSDTSALDKLCTPASPRQRCRPRDDVTPRACSVRRTPSDVVRTCRTHVRPGSRSRTRASIYNRGHARGGSTRDDRGFGFGGYAASG